MWRLMMPVLTVCSIALPGTQEMVLAQTTAHPAISVEEPWTRATLGNATVTAAYMLLRNSGQQPDRLIAASSPIAGRVELQTMSMDGDVMRMRPIDGIDVPVATATALEPGGLHIMLLDLRQPLRAGAQFPLTLRFEHAGTVDVSVTVRGIGRAPAAAMPQHQHH